MIKDEQLQITECQIERKKKCSGNNRFITILADVSNLGRKAFEVDYLTELSTHTEKAEEFPKLPVVKNS